MDAVFFELMRIRVVRDSSASVGMTSENIMNYELAIVLLLHFGLQFSEMYGILSSWLKNNPVGQMRPSQ